MTRFNDILNGIKENLIKVSKSNMRFKMGDKVLNVNSSCLHYKSKGKVCGIEKLPNEMGDLIVYETTNSGQNWKMGDMLRKTPDQLTLDYSEGYDDVISEEKEMDSYKQSYYDMSVGSLRAIMNHAKDILDYLDSPMVKENLTAPHLQGIIAVAEDHMRGIHDFVMFVETDDDDYEESDAQVSNDNKKRKQIKVSDLPHYEYQYREYPGVTTIFGENKKPGLWENIRKKKEREGKKYKPAKRGDPNRPDPKSWKEAQK